jgi:hypothetical protein
MAAARTSAARLKPGRTHPTGIKIGDRSGELQLRRSREVQSVHDVSKFLRARLAFASCAFVVILTYVAWQNQQRARPVVDSAAVSSMELASAPRPEAVPPSAMDPRPGWGGATVPQLPSVLVRSEEEATAAEVPANPVPPAAGGPEVTASSQARPELAAPTSASELASIPLPRPRPRKPPVTSATGAPLRLN